jgi:hypothetical protein
MYGTKLLLYKVRSLLQVPVCRVPELYGKSLAGAGFQHDKAAVLTDTTLCTAIWPNSRV